MKIDTGSKECSVIRSDQSRSMPDPLLDRLMDEAKRLAEDARDYLQHQRELPNDQSPLEHLEDMAEISRITTRVGMTVAWILARKAINAGELSAEEGRQNVWRLGNVDACSAAALGGAWPMTLQRLSERSCALYQRIARLDSDIDEIFPMRNAIQNPDVEIMNPVS